MAHPVPIGYEMDTKRAASGKTVSVITLGLFLNAGDTWGYLRIAGLRDRWVSGWMECCVGRGRKTRMDLGDGDGAKRGDAMEADGGRWADLTDSTVSTAQWPVYQLPYFVYYSTMVVVLDKLYSGKECGLL